MTSAARFPHKIVVAVDPDVRGMSRVADLLEAAPFLPTRMALRQAVTIARRSFAKSEGAVAAVIPTTHPGLFALAAALRTDRIAAYHTAAVKLSRWDAALMRAAFAFVDLTLAADEAGVRAAIALGADPDRTTIQTASVIDRLFDEPERKRGGSALAELGASLLLDLAASAGVLDALERFSPDQGVNVVNYHRILPLDELATYCRPQMALAEPVFEAQLDLMAARRGFTPVDHVLDQGCDGKIAITFDDGYEDNFRVALPILRRFSTPACIFVVTGLIGQPDALWWDRVGLALFAWWRAGAPGPLPAALPSSLSALEDLRSHEAARTLITGALSELNQVSQEAREAAVAAAEAMVPNLGPQRTMLSWDEVSALAQAGVRFGSHTKSHVPLDELGPAEARAELLGSQADLEARLGATSYRTTALPRGRLGPVREDELRIAFDAVMTTEPGVNRPGDDALYIRRRDGRMLTLAGRHHPAKLRLELTGLVDRLRRAYHARTGQSME